MRDNKWLEDQLQFLLRKYFSNVSLTNPIEIKFGREAKYRFGSIRLYKPRRSSRQRPASTRGERALPEWAGRFRGLRRLRGLGGQIPGYPRAQALEWRSGKLQAKTPQKSIIMITSLFARDNVPVKVVQYTVAHELCHYAHGFSSANKQLFKHPHHGGIVNKELAERGAEDLTFAYKRWLKVYRLRILEHKIKI